MIYDASMMQSNVSSFSAEYKNIKRAFTSSSLHKTDMDHQKHICQAILDYHREGQTRLEISKLMKEQFGTDVLHRNTIAKLWKKFGNMEDKPRSEKP